jgi:hypothetical protein
MAATMMVCVPQAFGRSSVYTIHITTGSPGAEQVVSIGSWYRLSDNAGWTFHPEEDIDRVELALYDSTAVLAAGTTPFGQYGTRTSGLWPDGPENELGELGYEVSPNVLGDNNQHLYGRPHYQSMKLLGGHRAGADPRGVGLARRAGAVGDPDPAGQVSARPVPPEPVTVSQRLDSRGIPSSRPYTVCSSSRWALTYRSV